MLTKKIKFDDWDGNPREETWYFALSDAEITEWELSESGGLSAMIDKIKETQDVPALIALYKEVILKTVGKKDADGRRFRKSDEIRQEFQETGAYSALYMELATDAEAGAAFINGLISDKLRAAVAENGGLPTDPNHPALKH